MDRIDGVKVGGGISAKWANDLIAEIRRLNIIPGNGIRKTVTSKGVRIDIDIPPETSGGNVEGVVSDVIPCVVSGGGTLSGYSVNLYANGLNQRSTGNGVLYLPELTTQTVLPYQSSILAHVCPATYTASDEDGDDIGGNEEEEEES